MVATKRLVAVMSTAGVHTDTAIHSDVSGTKGGMTWFDEGATLQHHDTGRGVR